VSFDTAVGIALVATFILLFIVSRVFRAVVLAIIFHPFRRTEIYVEGKEIITRVVRPEKISVSPGPPNPRAGIKDLIPPQIPEPQETAASHAG